MVAQLRELNNEQIQRMAPAAFANQPIEGVSRRYDFIPTIQVVDLMRDAGWLPVAASQAKVRKAERNGFQRHVIRFAHPMAIFDRGERLEIAVYNSHDKGCAFQLTASVYRLICGNGLLHASDLFNFSHRHVGFDGNLFIESAQQIFSGADEIAGQVEALKAIEMTPDERGVFAQAAHQLVYDEPEKAPISHDRLLRERRFDDKGKDLWSTFNVIQENVIRGGLPGLTRGQNGRLRRTRTRPVMSIEKDKKLNKALWTLTEKMAELKAA